MEQGHVVLKVPDRDPVRIPEDQLRYDPRREIDLPVRDIVVKNLVYVESEECSRALSEFLGGQYIVATYHPYGVFRLQYLIVLKPYTV